MDYAKKNHFPNPVFFVDDGYSGTNYDRPGFQSMLVEIEAGMVWHHAGQIDGVQTFAEAASDYWRLYHRLSDQFRDLGERRASVMMHAHGRITLLPCGTGMLLVTVTRQSRDVDWDEWQRRTHKLASMVNEL